MLAERLWSSEVQLYCRLHLFPGENYDACRLNALRAETLYLNTRDEFGSMVEKLGDGEVIDFEELRRMGKELWIARCVRAKMEQKLNQLKIKEKI